MAVWWVASTGYLRVVWRADQSVDTKVDWKECMTAVATVQSRAVVSVVH